MNSLNPEIVVLLKKYTKKKITKDNIRKVMASIYWKGTEEGQQFWYNCYINGTYLTPKCCTL